MNYIVLDMEWNQPFSVNRMIMNPIALRGEIVQIGAVKLDEKFNIVDTFKLLVSPKHYTKMHKKVAKLTGITTEELQYGLPFTVAFSHFRKWCGEEFYFFTWGEDDIGILRQNLLLHKINTDWLPNTYNIQLVFDDQITKEGRQISLTNAMEKIGEPALEAHDALNDARNTACICAHLDMDKGLAEYSTVQFQKNARYYETRAIERIESTKTYATKQAAINDKELTDFYCASYKTYISCGGFIHQNANKYICIGKCDDGNELFVRFKFTKLHNDRFSVSVNLYEMNEENKNYYLSKKLKKQKADEAKADYLNTRHIAG